MNESIIKKAGIQRRTREGKAKMNLDNFWIMEEEHIHFATIPIKFVIRNPQIFDIDADEIYAAYRRHQEGLGYRGVAWWWIKLELFRSGWILASHQSPKDGDRWLFEFATLEEALDPTVRFLKKYYGDCLFPPTSRPRFWKSALR